ncbi:hypothetical protein O3P69_012570 [Scylla paramamosain]|uniref:Uncharacterized protein n=1 Tax=Scylla paramamosain TaxID=85552 RepID=A0AAW0SGC9_SCYPA
MVLWDFKARCADVRCQAIEPLSDGGGGDAGIDTVDLWGHVYAFDQGLSGQPGTKTPHSRELPQVVVCPWLSPGGASLLDYAEEDSPSVCLRQVR